MSSSLPVPNEKPVAAIAGSAQPIDLSVVLKRCGGDAKFAGAVTERFRTQAGKEVDRIAQALEAGDAVALSRFAHSLKSMTAYMGAETSCNLARQIEELGRANQLAEVATPLQRLRFEIAEAVAWIELHNGPRAKCA